MPAQEIAFRRQKACVWEITGYDRNGQPVFQTSPTELDVRWNDTRSEVIDRQGNTVAIDATAILDRELKVDSLMVPLALADLPGDGDYGLLADGPLHIVVKFDSTPDIKNRARHNQASLKRYKDVTYT